MLCGFKLIKRIGTQFVRLGGVMPVLQMSGKAGKGGGGGCKLEPPLREAAASASAG